MTALMTALTVLYAAVRETAIRTAIATAALLTGFTAVKVAAVVLGVGS